MSVCFLISAFLRSRPSAAATNSACPLAIQLCSRIGALWQGAVWGFGVWPEAPCFAPAAVSGLAVLNEERQGYRARAREARIAEAAWFPLICTELLAGVVAQNTSCVFSRHWRSCIQGSASDWISGAFLGRETRGVDARACAPSHQQHPSRGAVPVSLPSTQCLVSGDCLN